MSWWGMLGEAGPRLVPSAAVGLNRRRMVWLSAKAPGFSASEVAGAGALVGPCLSQSERKLVRALRPGYDVTYGGELVLASPPAQDIRKDLWV